MFNINLTSGVSVDVYDTTAIIQAGYSIIVTKIQAFCR